MTGSGRVEGCVVALIEYARTVRIRGVPPASRAWELHDMRSTQPLNSVFD